MTLIDSSVWSLHFRETSERLVCLLEVREAQIHPWIIGELALGPGLRLDVLDDLAHLPSAPIIPHDDLLGFIRLHQLRGVGYVDAQLLVSAMTAGSHLWTLDQRLSALAARFNAGCP